MSTAVSRGKISFRSLVIINLALCTAMFIYMCFLIRTVPKTAENSKAGLFAELVGDLLQKDPSAGAMPDKEAELPAINARLQHFVPEGGLRLGDLKDWQLVSWKESTVHGRPIIKLHLHDGQGRDIVLALFALAKRHFPKTGGFAYKDAWFFTYGKDHGEAQIPAHQKEVNALKDAGLNLVATNYGNDYFLLMLSSMDSEELAHELFKLTTTYQTAP